MDTMMIAPSVAPVMAPAGQPMGGGMMARWFVGRLVMPAVSAVATALVSLPASAESGGSIKEAYARACPQHQDTEVCNALRAAISSPQVEPSVRAAHAAQQAGAVGAPGSLGMVVHNTSSGAVVVAAVGPGTPADLAGLKRGDLLLQIDGERIAASEDIPKFTGRHVVGDTLVVDYQRGPTKGRVLVTLAPPATSVVNVVGKKLPAPATGQRSAHSYPFEVEASRGYLIVVRSPTPIWVEVREGSNARGSLVGFGDNMRGTTTTFQPAKDGVHVVTLQSTKAAEYGVQVLEYERPWLKAPDLLDEVSGKTFCAEADLVWCYQFEATSSGVHLRHTKSDGSLLDDATIRRGPKGGMTYRSTTGSTLQVKGVSRDLITVSSPSGLNNWGLDLRGNLLIVHNWSGKEIQESYYTLRGPAYVAEYKKRWSQAAQLAAAREAERKAERRAAFGQLLATSIAVAGVAATGGDLEAIPLTGNPLEILNGANAEIARQNEIGQARLDATIANAQRQTESQESSGAGSRPAGVATAAAPNPSSTRTSVRQAVRFYYVGGMTPRATDTRNPRCYSNVVTLIADLPADRSQASEKAHELAEGYRSSFLRACESAGSGPLNDTYVTVEGLDSGWPFPSWHPSDIGVRLQ